MGSSDSQGSRRRAGLLRVVILKTAVSSVTIVWRTSQHPEARSSTPCSHAGRRGHVEKRTNALIAAMHRMSAGETHFKIRGGGLSRSRAHESATSDIQMRRAIIRSSRFW